jgi:hypothetical protein
VRLTCADHAAAYRKASDPFEVTGFARCRSRAGTWLNCLMLVAGADLRLCCCAHCRVGPTPNQQTFHSSQAHQPAHSPTDKPINFRMPTLFVYRLPARVVRFRLDLRQLIGLSVEIITSSNLLALIFRRDKTASEHDSNRKRLMCNNYFLTYRAMPPLLLALQIKHHPEDSHRNIQ